MNISELIARLNEVLSSLGDMPVFFGSYYQDVPVEGVEIEDGYPLIFNLSGAPQL